MSGAVSKSALIKGQSLFLRLGIHPPQVQRLTHTAYSRYVFNSINAFADVMYCRPSFAAGTLIQTRTAYLDVVLSSTEDVSRLSSVMAGLVGIDMAMVGLSKPLETKTEILRTLHNYLGNSPAGSTGTRDPQDAVEVNGIYVSRAQGETIYTAQGESLANNRRNFEMCGWEELNDQSADIPHNIIHQKDYSSGRLLNPDVIGISTTYFNNVNNIPAGMRHWLYGLNILDKNGTRIDHALSKEDKHALDIMLHGFKGF